jgi:hypothetical protein
LQLQTALTPLKQTDSLPTFLYRAKDGIEVVLVIVLNGAVLLLDLVTIFIEVVTGVKALLQPRP